MSCEDQEVRAVVEDGSNGGSGSPSPGDTLPWNLEKTQRSRRGGGGPGGNGSVLDPAESSFRPAGPFLLRNRPILGNVYSFRSVDGTQFLPTLSSP